MKPRKGFSEGAASTGACPGLTAAILAPSRTMSPTSHIPFSFSQSSGFLPESSSNASMRLRYSVLLTEASVNLS